ncbi:galactose-1-phosphate uridylyltransferase [Erythrobacter litoralis]|uniref:Galactose-1-phosphate uridylyltransferase n=1 Tax=Erythrobacter litoralis (strain HTCC2594) TaxID=314225 RepID=Q2NBZ8_ERYLH|nr:galactose-1-phosphate uridylyltransferase [Erythrobacter litoralis]ABC62793.1 galactose-1-phosphate uridylyltransferase [Erythrobacter litoralis HTCC2594]
MSNALSAIGSDASGRAVHRREVIKADGRMLRLYGHLPHTLERQAEETDDIALGGELRFHPLRREWNIYAAHRQNRTFKPAASADPLAPTLSDGAATEIPFADFELAIFDNKFAGLHPSAPPAPDFEGVATAQALGACEVVVYSAESKGNLWSIGQERRELLLAALEDRYRALFDAGCDYVLPFENRGDEVGVTLPHPHGQIYGFHKMPQVQQLAVDAFAGGYDLAGEIERALPLYAVAEQAGVAAWCPRYARFPFEVWIAPRARREGLHDMTDTEKSGFAALLGEITRRYDALFQRPAATMMALHAAPRGGSDGYHVTAQFYPLLRAPDRVKYLASVEQHTGVMTVDVMPEAAAAALREV